ncbi:MAG: glycosyltransferase family 4 protein [Candidatus Krumholzibacteria bacterium]|nr:glycosyltransferase family 4 protein [Candidatus Krumholzibacteria bacterium]
MLETVAALREQGFQADIVAQPGSELHRRARSAQIPVTAIPIRFDAAPWTLAKLVRHFRRTGTTAVWANLTKDLKAASVAGRLAGVRTIFGSRESDFPLKSKLYYRWYFNSLATGLLVNSEATRRTVLASAPWLRTDRVHLLYKGIDTDRFRPSPKRYATPVVGFVGQLIERKGIRDLMEAWTIIDSEARSDHPVLRLAGEGPLREEILAWRDTLARPAGVELAGFVEKVETFHQGLSMLLMPSLSEGFGLAAAEASACGIPVIATATSSLPEIVIHEKTGLLVPPRDPVTLAGAVRTLLNDPGLGHRLGLNGRARIVTEFSRDRTLERLLELTGGIAMSPQEGRQP